MHRAVVFASVVVGLLATPLARAQSVGEALLALTITAATDVLLAAVIPEPVARPSVPAPEAHVELSDWVDPNTGSTARAGRACEQRYVAYLTGTRGANYLEVKLFNDSADEVVIVARSPELEEASLLVPDAGRNAHKWPFRAAGHSGLFLGYRLEKARFHRLKRFEVTFELSFSTGHTCRMNVEFSRVLPAAPSSFKIYSKLDFGATFGVHLASGSLRDAIGAVAASSGISISWFPAVQHGVRFEAGFDRMDRHRFAGGTLLLPAYEFRIFLGPRVTYSFGIGAGAYLFTASEDVPADPYEDVPVDAARWALQVRERMQLKVELLPPRWFIDLALGPVVTFGVFPGGPFGPRELSGALYTGSLELTVSM